MGNESSSRRRQGSEPNEEISLKSVGDGLQDRQNDVEEGIGKSV